MKYINLICAKTPEDLFEPEFRVTPGVSKPWIQTDLEDKKDFSFKPHINSKMFFPFSLQTINRSYFVDLLNNYAVNPISQYNTFCNNNNNNIKKSTSSLVRINASTYNFAYLNSSPNVHAVFVGILCSSLWYVVLYYIVNHIGINYKRTLECGIRFAKS